MRQRRCHDTSRELTRLHSHTHFTLSADELAQVAQNIPYPWADASMHKLQQGQPVDGIGVRHALDQASKRILPVYSLKTVDEGFEVVRDAQ